MKLNTTLTMWGDKTKINMNKNKETLENILRLYEAQIRRGSSFWIEEENRTSVSRDLADLEEVRLWLEELFKLQTN